MPLPGSLRKNVSAVLLFDVHGRCSASYEFNSAKNSWQPLVGFPEKDSLRPCVVVLPSSMVALCRTQIPNKEQKDVAAALGVEAGQRLFRTPETGGQEFRFYNRKNEMSGTLGWLSHEYLHQCLETTKEMGFQASSIVHPEFDLNISEPTLFISCEKEEVRLCVIHKNVPLRWQVVPEGGPSFISALGVILSELKADELPDPEKVALWIPPGIEADETVLNEAIESLLPGVPLDEIRSYDALLERLRLNRSKGSFHESLEDWERIPLTPKDYIKPGLSLAGAVAGCLLLFFSMIHLNNQDAVVLKEEAHKILFLAKRTDLVTMEVREYVRRNNAILKYTVKKPFVSHVFRDLGDAVPAQMKLNTMRLGQSGRITLQGEAKSEISLMSLLENLSSTEIFTNAVLSSMSKLEHGQGFRFVVELEFPAWQEFFKQQKKQGAAQ